MCRLNRCGLKQNYEDGATSGRRSVHVVFGLVISGFEVIKKIEGLKTDTASRPYADVRVIDCGQLITKSAKDVLEGRKRKAFYSEDDSQSSSESQFSSLESGKESNERYSRRRKKTSAKSKHSKRRRKEIARKPRRHEKAVVEERPSKRETVEKEQQKEHNVKREKPMVRPEEIPPVPENRFLLRRDMPAQEETTNVAVQDTDTAPTDPKPAVTKSGRKLKGRGTMRYHTPTRSLSRSESEEERGSSETPPHWKEEMQRTKTYQPPSVEKWSKGERWDESSATPRSRSRSREYSSDRVSDHSSQRHYHRKEKSKAKRKKKAKKRKHTKKHKKTKHTEASLSEGEVSVSSGKRSKPSNQPERRSYTRSCSPNSPHRSRRSYRSERKRSTSRSSRESRSYSRSRDGSYSTSRSRSGSRFRSYTRSRSGSESGRSSSDSRSRYRTRSKTRSRSRYKSPLSPYYRNKNASKLSEGSAQNVKNPVSSTAQAVEPKAPAATESVPVLPLSDSPPPSRWKPGQKPWKPSYVRIQEIKAKKDSPSPSLTSRTPVMPPETPSVVQSQSEEPTSHKGLNSSSQYSGKPKQPEGLRKGSSGSPSSSHSRSRSRSSYQSVSPGQYSRSSLSSPSSSRSDSYYSYRRTSSERKEKRCKRDHKRTKNVKRSPVKEHASASRSDGGTDSTHGPVQKRSVSRDQVAFDSVPDFPNKTEKKPKTNSATAAAGTSGKSGSGWESDSEHLTKPASAHENKPPRIPVKEESGLNEMKKMNIWARCWDSESESEVPEANNAQNKAASEKEEGEASSESESQAPSRPSNKPERPSKDSGEFKNASGDYTRHEKRKSKKAKRKHKRKRRNSERAGSKRAKAKTKRSKRKHQKPKETFHWQPPLEFGDEGEEDDSLAQGKSSDPAQHVEKSEALKGAEVKSQHPENKDLSTTIRDSSQGSCSAAEISKSGDESINLGKKRQLKPNTGRARKSPAQSKQSSVNVANTKDQTKEQDDMEICTPENNANTDAEPDASGGKDLANQLLLPPSDPKPSESSSSCVTPALRVEDSSAPGVIGVPGDPKWKPLKGTSVVGALGAAPLAVKANREREEGKTQGLKIEIKSTNRVRPGSLFDEVRKTARLNQRPRNQDSSSEEESPAAPGEQDASQKHSRSKSRSASGSRPRHRDRSRSYTFSRSRSRSCSYSSRSYSRSRSRRSYSRERSRSPTSSYQSYRSHTYSRSGSRSRSRGRQRSRSYTYDSYSSRSRSHSRRRRHRRSESYDRRSRSYRSYTRSSSRHRSRSSRYS